MLVHANAKYAIKILMSYTEHSSAVGYSTVMKHRYAPRRREKKLVVVIVIVSDFRFSRI